MGAGYVAATLENAVYDYDITDEFSRECLAIQLIK